mmetsp:Transcript_15072/g.34196  ORF Transcript_15072/g.34196 Transcript_15072/m.34196 type:complete len:285 (+) Transcript_15072:3-857(+)
MVDATAEEALARQYVPSGQYPQLMWFMHGEPTQYHKSMRTAKGITDFVFSMDREAITTVESEEDGAIFERAVFGQLQKDSPAFRALEATAMKHMDTLMFSHMESDAGIVTFISEEREPTKFEGEFTFQALDSWVKEQLRLSAVSDPVPEEPYDEGALVVVGQNFEDLVLRDDKDVFLLIYASWCGFSKKFQPVWRALAHRLAGVPHLVVAKMDGDRNKPFVAPGDIYWDAYPTIFYFRAGQGVPAKFEGGNRTIANLVEFAREHGSKPLELGPSVGEADVEMEL